MTGVFVGILGLMIWGLLAKDKRAQEEFEKRQIERWQEYVSAVKAGNDGSGIFVNDPTLVEMLANEPDCIANLTTLYFSMAELDDARFAAFKKLTNLKSVGFYDCQGMDAAAKTIEGMPSIEEIWCEGECFTAAGVKSLATLPNLKRVEFVWEVDPAYEQLLRTTLPNVEIKLPPSEELETQQPNDRDGQK